MTADCIQGAITMSDNYKTADICATTTLSMCSSYGTYVMKMPDEQHQQLGITDYGKSTTMLDYSKNSSDYGFNSMNI